MFRLFFWCFPHFICHRFTLWCHCSSKHPTCNQTGMYCGHIHRTFYLNQYFIVAYQKFKTPYLSLHSKSHIQAYKYLHLHMHTRAYTHAHTRVRALTHTHRVLYACTLKHTHIPYTYYLVAYQFKKDTVA